MHTTLISPSFAAAVGKTVRHQIVHIVDSFLKEADPDAVTETRMRKEKRTMVVSGNVTTRDVYTVSVYHNSKLAIVSAQVTSRKGEKRATTIARLLKDVTETCSASLKAIYESHSYD